LTLNFTDEELKRLEGIENFRLHKKISLVCEFTKQIRDCLKDAESDLNVPNMAEKTILEEIAALCMKCDFVFDSNIFNHEVLPMGLYPYLKTQMDRKYFLN